MLVGRRRLKMGLKLFSCSIVLLICASRARKSLPWAYNHIWIRDLHTDSNEMCTSATMYSWNPDTALINSTVKFAEESWAYQRQQTWRSTHILFPSVIQKPSASINHWICAGSTQEITPWCSSEGDDFPLLGLFVDFDIQIIFLLKNAALHEYTGLHAHSKLISPSILGQAQTLLSPFFVIESIFECLQGNIRQMRVLDDEGSCKSIIKLCNEFWK